MFKQECAGFDQSPTFRLVVYHASKCLKTKKREDWAACQGPFAPIIGQKAQGCWLGYGSLLFLEFAEPQPLNERSKFPQGGWSLWCEQILWRFEQGDHFLAESEDDGPAQEATVEQINGPS